MTSEKVLDYIHKYGVKRKTKEKDQMLIQYYESLHSDTQIKEMWMIVLYLKLVWVIYCKIIDNEYGI